MTRFIHGLFRRRNRAPELPRSPVFAHAAILSKCIEAGRAALLIFLLSRAGGSVLAAPNDDAGASLFSSYILPLLKENCYSCHSHESGKAKGGLVLDSRAGWQRGGDRGPAILPGEPDQSLLLQAASHRHAELKMPPPGQGARLSDQDLERLRTWIALGAPDPRHASIAAPEAINWDEARRFWSFQPVRRPPIPETEGAVAVIRTPIDAFVLRKLQEQELTLSPEADPRILLRRLSFDLTGLPPAPEEIEAFVADKSPRAYENRVERLLASPHYGERWGRHWLDVAGFAESSMFIGDQFRPDFWRYRDYVIRSFNDDKPYDEFVREQLAGDELFDWRAAEKFTAKQIDQLVATGFLRCTPDATDNQAITQEEKIYAAQQNAVEVAAKALMGLTLNCVRCHSHKYDPIPHEDYYKLVAVFQPAFDPEQWLAGIWSKGNPGPIRAIALLDREARLEHERHLAEIKSQRMELRRQFLTDLPQKYRNRYLREHLEKIQDLETRGQAAALLEGADDEIGGAQREWLANLAAGLGIDSEQLLKIYPEFEEEQKRLRARLTELGNQAGDLPPVAWGVFDVSRTSSPTRLLRRGNYETPAETVGPGVMTVLDDPENPCQIPAEPALAHSSGRRLRWAQWLTRREHPLAARVMVNRIWQYHFGTGLVATPDDFGARGARPTHPELLDWLAAEFMDHGWSIKHLHRLVLLSSVYRQASWDDPARRARDPSNQWLWRFPQRRLEAEAIRDAMLEVSGRLDRRMFGETVPTKRMPDGHFAVAPDQEGRQRRSVYLTTRRTWVPTFLTTFDAPVMDTNWPKRTASTIPQQALAVMNNAFVLENAEYFAKRVLAEAGPGRAERLRHAWLLAYGREPLPHEIQLVEPILEPMNTADPGDLLRVWTTIGHALLSSNEFIYVD